MASIRTKPHFTPSFIGRRESKDGRDQRVNHDQGRGRMPAQVSFWFPGSKANKRAARKSLALESYLLGQFGQAFETEMDT